MYIEEFVLGDNAKVLFGHGFQLLNHDNWLSVSLFAQTSLVPSIVDKAENKGFLICGYVNNCEMLLRLITVGEISTFTGGMIVTTTRELENTT